MKRFLLRAIDGYQRGREGRPSPCRFFPSCSEYAREAITVHGARRGSWLTARRLMRCRPFGPSGFDPVPEREARGHDHSSCSTHTMTSLPVTSHPVTSHPMTSHPIGRAS